MCACACQTASPVQVQCLSLRTASRAEVCIVPAAKPGCWALAGQRQLPRRPSWPAGCHLIFSPLSLSYFLCLCRYSSEDRLVGTCRASPAAKATQLGSEAQALLPGLHARQGLSLQVCLAACSRHTCKLQGSVKRWRSGIHLVQSRCSAAWTTPELSLSRTVSAGRQPRHRAARPGQRVAVQAQPAWHSGPGGPGAAAR